MLKKTKIRLYLLLLPALVLFACSTKKLTLESTAEDNWVENMLSTMTIEEKAGQMITVPISPEFNNVNSQYFKDRIEKQILNNKVGGFILYSGTAAQTAVLTNRLQSLSRIPLLFASDLESGLGNKMEGGIHFPHNMALGATRSEKLAFLQGKVTAIEARAVGIHQTYAPVVDVNNNADNPIINFRSYGEDPEIVSKLGAAFIRGCQENGLIATAKHFPGHGDTNVDSHSRLAVINSDINRLNKIELPPFKAAIEAGVKSIMTAHISVPALEESNLPSTLSTNILTDLLSNELGFSGIIVTDAMEMGGITNEFSISDAAIRTIKAGTDMVLVPPDAALAQKAIVKAVRDSIISIDRIDRSVRKILEAKKWLNLDINRFVNPDKINELLAINQNITAAEEIAVRSVTLLRNENKIIPINQDSIPKTLILNISNDLGEPGVIFKNQLRSRLSGTTSAFIDERTNDLEFENIIRLANESEIIICGIFVRVQSKKDYIALNEQQSDYFNKILDLDKKVITTAFGSPYVISQFPDIKTYICTYSNNELSQRAAANAITKFQPVTGKLPVSIPDLHKLGEGLEISPEIISNLSEKGISLSESTPYSAGFIRDFDEKLESVIFSGIKEEVTPGAVCLVGRKGSIVFNKAFGTFTYEMDSPAVSKESIFDLASLTKVIATSTLTMIYYDKGLIELEAPVRKYLPKMKNGDKITIKNLLTHTSGLPAFRRFYTEFNGKNEIINQIFNTDLQYEPGQETVYSDIGMMLMALILEKLSEKDLNKLAKDEIFEPLGMNRTFFNPPAEYLKDIIPTENDPWRGRIVQGEVHDENAFAFGGIAGHAGLFSTGTDLSKICQLLLNRGIYDDKRLIQPETVDLFLSKQNIVEGSSRALGWDTRSEPSSSGVYFSDDSNGHTGFTGTSIWIDPDRDLFVILLTNRVHPTRSNQKISDFRKIVHDTIMEMIRF
ncbi:glycoside hydrolase family 3 N-terminal domain-containing protein [candidate division KSB1 bacterium]